MFLIVEVLASVNASIWPGETAGTAHAIFGPLAAVLFTVCPAIHTVTVQSVTLKVPGVAGAIWPQQLAFATFLTFAVLTFEPSTVWPKLNSFTMLLVVAPLAIV